MAAQFTGFTPETTEILMGIRMNNTKEWYQAHKEDYAAHVRNPMVLLADECCAFMQQMDNAFTPRPKVSRPYRDTRFAANKDPIKECIWFFLRNDASPGIQHSEPTYFFEVSPDWWRMGLGYWPMKAAQMGAFRTKVAAASDLAARLFAEAQKESGFTLEGDMYKKTPKTDGISETAAALFAYKNLTLIKYGQHDTTMCNRKLLDEVCEGFRALHPLYQYILETSQLCTDTKK